VPFGLPNPSSSLEQRERASDKTATLLRPGHPHPPSRPRQKRLATSTTTRPEQSTFGPSTTSTRSRVSSTSTSRPSPRLDDAAHSPLAVRRSPSLLPSFLPSSRFPGPTASRVQPLLLALSRDLVISLASNSERLRRWQVGACFCAPVSIHLCLFTRRALYRFNMFM
jgi:hypothetical protein